MAGGTIFTQFRKDLEKKKAATRKAGGATGKKGKRITMKPVTPKKKKKTTRKPLLNKRR